MSTFDVTEAEALETLLTTLAKASHAMRATRGWQRVAFVLGSHALVTTAAVLSCVDEARAARFVQEVRESWARKREVGQ